MGNPTMTTHHFLLLATLWHAVLCAGAVLIGGVQ
jgi:hypothetical protein